MLRQSSKRVLQPVNLFKEEQTFTAWSQSQQDAACVTLPEAQIFAVQRNAVRYPTVDLRS